MPDKDPYELLGVPKGASKDTLHKAYRRLAREHHPDARPNDPRAEERFKEIQQAYDVLVNAEKKRGYEANSRTSPQAGPSGARTRPGERYGSSSVSPGGLADLLAGLSDLSRDPPSVRKEFIRELRSEDVVRIAKLFSVDLTRVAKLLDKGVKMKADASFGVERAGNPSARGMRMRGGAPPGQGSEKPPVPPKPLIPRKPPKPPRTERPDGTQ